MRRRRRRRRRSWARRALVLVLFTSVSTLAVLFLASHLVWTAGESQLFDHVDDVPATGVGLVLGCPPKIPGGHANAYFEGRVQAAAQLFHAGKVQYLLVSGHRTDRYDEPKAMREALLLRGVPEASIVADNAGSRTLDSVVRAKHVFGQNEVVVVSQEFHNRRALFLAQQVGLEASAYNAADVERGLLARLRWREAAARVVAAADAFLLGTEAKQLDERIPIGPRAIKVGSEGASGEGAV